MKLLRSKKGQSMVEVSLIAPLLLIALYVPADFGIALFTAHLTQNAVREGSRIGTNLLTCGSSPCIANVSNESCPSTNSVASEVCARLPGLLNSPLITVTLTSGAGCMQSVRVSATGNYNLFLYQLMRLLGMTAPDTVALSRTTEMRYDIQSTSLNTPC